MKYYLFFPFFSGQNRGDFPLLPDALPKKPAEFLDL